MQKKPEKDLVIVGAGHMGAALCRYFQRDYKANIAGFVVDNRYQHHESLLQRPIVSADCLRERFPPHSHCLYIAFTRNTLVHRQRYEHWIKQAREWGYDLASYISPYAYVDETASLGASVTVFECNVIQHDCRIEEGVLLWSGNHIGHGTIIGSHTFVSSHVVIGGNTRIGKRCYVGINSTINDKLVIGEDCTINSAACVSKDMDSNSVAKSPPMMILKGVSKRLWQLAGKRFH